MAFGNFATWAWLLGAGPCTGNAEEKSWKLRASSFGSVNKVAYPLLFIFANAKINKKGKYLFLEYVLSVLIENLRNLVHQILVVLACVQTVSGPGQLCECGVNLLISCVTLLPIMF